MRKCIKLLIIMVMMILPIYVKGSKYTVEQGYAQEYLNRSNYVHTYSRYLLNNDESPYTTKKIPFGFSNGNVTEVSGFSKAGFISKEEYELTIDRKLYGTGKELSYLNEGMGFWIIDTIDDQAYAVNNRGKITLVSKDSSNYGRATVFVKSDTKISGIGTISQPYTFDPIYKVTIKTVSKNAQIEREIAPANERSACVKNQANCSEDFGYVRGNCKQDDCTLEVKYKTTDGYVYMADDCGGVNNSNRNTISVSNVDRDTICNVTFGIGRYKLTLHNTDVTERDNAENEVDPNTIYLKYGTGFYTDYDFLSQIRKLTTLPVKSGRRFDGFVNRDKTIWLVDKEGIINQNVKDKITVNMHFYIEWYHNKYNIRYIPGHESVVLGTSSPTLGIYDDEAPLKIDPPTRQGYIFKGWKVQGIDLTTAKYGTTSSNVNTSFTSDGQTLNANVKYFFNLSQVDGSTVTFTATWEPRTDTLFTVNRWKQKVNVLDDTKNPTNYDLDVKTYTGTSDQNKQAPQDTFTGFKSISPIGEVFVKYDGSGVIDYYYVRNKVQLSFYMNHGTMQSNKGSNVSTNGDLITTGGLNYRKWNYEQIVRLPKWNDTSDINVRRTGYTPVSGNEWCTGQNGDGTCYKMDTDYTNKTAFCNAANDDCSVSLYINWKPTVYNITYGLNNGSHSQKPNKGTYDELVTVENPTKVVTITGNANGTGATISASTTITQSFTGWSSTTANGLDTTAKYGNDSTTTLSWNGSKVTSKYFRNLRSTEGTVQLTANWSSNSSGATPTVTKVGYECEWNTKQDKSGTTIASGGNYTPAANGPTSVTLYAFCNPIKYKIAYNKDGGTLGNPSPTEATYDSPVNIEHPKKAGYNFTGWTADSNLKTDKAKRGDSSSSITSSWSNASTKVKNKYYKNLTYTKGETVTLTANWGPIEYNVDYELNKGSFGTNHPTTIKYGEAKQINNPTKRVTVSGVVNGSGATIASATYADQTFAGWTADSNLNTTTAKTGSSSSAVTTSWTNGSTKVTTEWFKNLRNIEGTVKLTANWTVVKVKTPKVSRTGYDCWYNTSSDQSGTRIESEGNYTPSANGNTSISVYAFCSPKVFTITLNNHGATTGGTNYIYLKYNTGYYLDSAASSKKMTTSANAITKPEKAGFAFAGYYTAESGGTQIIGANGYLVSGASLTLAASNTTLHARWNDTASPTCKLKATASGVVFESTNDNVAVTASGINKSTTPAYTNQTAALSAGTFYGHVKDAAGNTGRCSIQIEATKETKWTATKQTCGSYTASYNCSTSATATPYCSSGWTKCSGSGCQCYKTSSPSQYNCCKQGYTYRGTTCNKVVADAVVDHWVCSGSEYAEGQNCYVNTSATKTVIPSGTYKGTCKTYGTKKGTCAKKILGICTKWNYVTDYSNCLEYNYPSCTVNTCSKDGCTCKDSYSCSKGTLTYGNKCKIFVHKSTTAYYVCKTGSLGSDYGCPQLKCCTFDNVYKCNSCSVGTLSGNLCYQYANYAGTNYSCPSGTLSGSTCVQNNVSSQISGWTCTGNTGYRFTSSELTNQTSCTTGTAPNCSSSSHSGNNYISGCTGSEWACRTSGFTKVNNSWCYKY